MNEKFEFSEQYARRHPSLNAAQRKWLAEHAQTIGYNFIDLTPFLLEAGRTAQ